MRVGTRTLAALIAVAGLMLGAGTVAPTSAAWQDRVHAMSAAASASSWDTPRPPTQYGPFSAGDDTALLAPPQWSLPETNGGTICATLTVTTTSDEPAPWSVVISVDQAPYWGLRADSFWGSDVTFTPMPGDDTRVVMSGTSPLPPGQTLTVTVCTWTDNAPPPAEADWYSVTTSPVPGATATRVCVDTTVTGRKDVAEYPFSFGWQATVDLSAARAQMTAAGGSADYVEWSPHPGDGYWFTAEASPTTPDVYSLTSGKMTALRGTQSVSITACLVGHATAPADDASVQDDATSAQDAAADAAGDGEEPPPAEPEREADPGVPETGDAVDDQPQTLGAGLFLDGRADASAHATTHGSRGGRSSGR